MVERCARCDAVIPEQSGAIAGIRCPRCAESLQMWVNETPNDPMPPVRYDRPVLQLQRSSIQNIEKEVNSIMIRLEAASVTYCNEGAIDFIDIRREIEDHFKNSPKDVREVSIITFEAFRQRVLKELEAEMKPYAEIKSKLNQLEAKRAEMSSLKGNADTNLQLTIHKLDAEIRQLPILVPKFQTKLFELKFKTGEVEIIETKVDFLLEIVFGPYIGDYRKKEKLKYHSGGRFQYPDGIRLFRSEEEFRKSSEFTFIGKHWFDLIEYTTLVFTMPNNFGNTERDMLVALKTQRAHFNAVVAVKLDGSKKIDEKLDSWVLENRLTPIKKI